MYSLGVDIGTTSVVAAVDRGDGAEVVVLGQSAVALPAVVHRHDDGSLRTGEPAARRAIATPHRVATALVRRLVDASPVVLGEHPQSVTTLLCVQLRDVLDAVREQEGDDPARLVLTRPTAWGAFREELFAQVPARLGWDDVTVVGDAAAAAAHHRRRHGRTGPETVAVLDLGAGADTTVLRFAGDGRDEVPQPVGAPEGIEDFAQACDDALLDLVDEACGGGLRDAATGDPGQSTALARLRVECAVAKEALSRDAEVLVPVLLAGRHRDVEVTRTAFEERIGPTVDAAVAALVRTVRAAGLDPADHDALPTVLLVGGGARIPLVARRASVALGRTVVADARASWAPALGAAGLAAAAGPRDPARVPEGPFRTWTPPRGVPPTADDAEHEDDAPTGPIPRVAAGDDPDATVRVPRDELEPDVPDVPEPEPDEPVREEPSAALPPEPDFRPVARRRAGRVWAFGVAAVGAVVAVVLVVVAVLLLASGGSPAPAPAAAPPVLPASLGPGPTSVAASVAVPRSAPDLPGAPTPGTAAFSPNGRLIYLADRATDTVTVVDTRDPGPRTTVAVPAGPPQYLTVAPDGRRVYASVWDDARTVAAVAVIDTVSRSVVATVPVRSRPFGLAVSPDGRTLWVPNQDTANVTVIDTTRNAVVRDVAVSSNPHWVAFSRDGTRVYVSLEDDDQVVELDPATDREISRVPTGTGPYAIAVHPTRPLGLVSNYAGDSVTAFDTEANRTLATIPVGRLPQVVAWAPDGRFAYVANTTDATVSVIDAATLAVTATLPTPPRPTGIAVAPDGRTAYVTCEGTLAVLDLAA